MRFFKHFLAKPQAKKTDLMRVYLDYASSTPLDATMLQTVPVIPEEILAANPSALHKEGVALKRYLSQARARIANVLEVHSDEVIFTSSATESDNLALLGTIARWFSDGVKSKEIVVYTSELEHAAVHETIEHTGVKHVVLPAVQGVINPKEITVPAGARAVLISVMYVNNEIGTVQPIQEIAKRVRHLRKEYPDVRFVFHTDATQAPAHYVLRVPSLGVDLMTLGATKLYCTKGVGVLYKRRTLALEPVMYGGGQEFGLRPGTEPVALIHEFSYALQYAHQLREKETKRITELQTYFESELKQQFKQIKVTAELSPRTPHITHIAIPKMESELLVLELDAKGIAVSAKSACKNEEGNESPIVESLYGKGYGAIRFSFGRMTTKKDLDHALVALKTVLQKYKNLI